MAGPVDPVACHELQNNEMSSISQFCREYRFIQSHVKEHRRELPPKATSYRTTACVLSLVQDPIGPFSRMILLCTFIEDKSKVCLWLFARQTWQSGDKKWPW